MLPKFILFLPSPLAGEGRVRGSSLTQSLVNSQRRIASLNPSPQPSPARGEGVEPKGRGNEFKRGDHIFGGTTGNELVKPPSTGNAMPFT